MDLGESEEPDRRVTLNEQPPPPVEALDVYKLAVEMADRVSARRGQANQFYVSLQTLLLGAPALVQLAGGAHGMDTTRAVSLAVVGLIVSVVWWLQLRSYRDLNSAKFAVINEIEEKYFSVRVFSDEWQRLKKDPVPKWRERYAELGTVERFVPWLFFGANTALILVELI